MNAEPRPPLATSHRARRSVRFLAIAIIAVIPLAACSSDTPDRSAGTDTESPTVPTTTPSSTASGTARVTADPGRGTTSFAGGDSVPVSFTLPTGWKVSDVFVNKPGSDPLVSVSFWDVADIYADPCQWELVDPPVGPTVDDLLSAWANVPALNATAAHDVTVDGYQGKQFDLTAPDFNPDECQREHLRPLARGRPARDGFPARWVEPNEHLQMWYSTSTARAS